MFSVFLKLLIFRVMIAGAIKHWLQGLHVLVKEISYLCVRVSENERVCLSVYMSAYASDRFST